MKRSILVLGFWFLCSVVAEGANPRTELKQDRVPTADVYIRPGTTTVEGITLVANSDGRKIVIKFSNANLPDDIFKTELIFKSSFAPQSGFWDSKIYVCGSNWVPSNDYNTINSLIGSTLAGYPDGYINTTQPVYRVDNYSGSYAIVAPSNTVSVHSSENSGGSNSPVWRIYYYGPSALAGDANLDGMFNSADLIQLFSRGKYDKNLHAGWGDGDFNNDNRFTSADLVAALAESVYDQGNAAAVALWEELNE